MNYQELSCPTCQTLLMQHERTRCLEDWFFSVLEFQKIHSGSEWAWEEARPFGEAQLWKYGISRTRERALDLMDMIFNLDEDARFDIVQVLIHLRGENTGRIVWGNTFMLRAIRAVIILATANDKR